ncbi:MAG: CheY-like chemotaxis protein [Limisphaerales bacterium]|jgi:CheY-like chemotaxis protein
MARILIVEDNEMNLEILSRRLARRGFEIVTAVDGVEGLARAEEANPDLIIMDMGLPLMDGYECTRQIKDAPTTSPIPVIALTAHAMPEDEARARTAGCDDFDTKPVDLNRLLEKISAFLPLPRQS